VSVPTSSTPKTVVDLAAACVRFVETSVGIAPDYTQDTLPLVDHYLEQLHDPPATTEVLGLVIPAVGAYFGEVIRRTLGDGIWHCPDDVNYEQWELRFLSCSMRFNPVALAYEIASNGRAEVKAAVEFLPAERAIAEQALKELGRVREEDYYRLAVRFDVIEQLYHLVTHQRANAPGNTLN
jgi:hypothetical protein